MIIVSNLFLYSLSAAHLDVYVLPHSSPTQRSSDLIALKAFRHARHLLASHLAARHVTGAIKPVAVLRELLPAFHEPISAQMGIGAHAGLLRHRLDHRPAAARRRLAEQCRIALHRRCEVARGSRPALVQRLPCAPARSEEHPSALPSLMR